MIQIATSGVSALAVCLVLLGASGDTDPPSVMVAADPSPAPTSTTLLATPATTSTTLPPTTTTTANQPPAPAVPTLPVPEPLPENPRGEDPDEPIGRIAIPAIGLDSDLGEGMTLTEIDRGPAHWPGTALPGGLGNVVVAGHRTTWSAPFRHLDDLRAGDQIRFSVGSRSAVYRVTETFVVEPAEVWIAEQTAGRIVTLFACHPVGSAAQRIVVRGELVPPQVPTAAA